MNFHRKMIASAVAVLAIGGSAINAQAATTINGSGSTFMQNIVDVCASKYNSASANTNKDTVSYTGTGSGTGKTQFAAGTTKWGGSDSLYSSGAPADLVYVPLVAGPVAISYRIDGILPAGTSLKLSSTTIAKIFAGQITKWNDAAIKADNKLAPVKAISLLNGKAKATIVKSGKTVKITVTLNSAIVKGNKITVDRSTNSKVKKGVKKVNVSRTITTFTVPYVAHSAYIIKLKKSTIGALSIDNIPVILPSTSIIVAHRSDNSGTSNVFTSYLNAVSPTIWTKSGNDSFTTAFPGTRPSDGSFQAATGSDGVTNYVKDHNGAIGYAEVSYVDERAAEGSKISAADVRNASGAYVQPTSAGAAAFFAAATVGSNGVVTRNFATKSATAYPISAIAYGLAHATTSTEATAVKAWFTYVLNTCAPKYAEAFSYSALSGAAKMAALAQVAKISAS